MGRSSIASHDCNSSLHVSPWIVQEEYMTGRISVSLILKGAHPGLEGVANMMDAYRRYRHSAMNGLDVEIL